MVAELAAARIAAAPAPIFLRPDKTRAEQMRRLDRSRAQRLEYQWHEAEDVAGELRAELKTTWCRLPPDLRKRYPVPSRQAIQAFVAFWRTCCLLKQRPMDWLRLTNAELGAALHVGHGVARRLLKWFGSDVIYASDLLVVAGLGLIERRRHFEPAKLHTANSDMHIVAVRERASTTSLSEAGRARFGITAALAIRAAADDSKGTPGFCEAEQLEANRRREQRAWWVRKRKAERLKERSGKATREAVRQQSEKLEQETVKSAKRYVSQHFDVKDGESFGPSQLFAWANSLRSNSS